MIVASTPVVFDFVAWATRYPELSAWVAQPLAQQYFNEAQLYVDNSACSVVPNIAPVFQRAMFLNMVTAHIAALNAPLSNQPSSPLVGRISQAAEGSVNVTTELNLPPGSPQWWAQSKYGIAFWAASSSYRTMRYMPGPRRVANPFSPR